MLRFLTIAVGLAAAPALAEVPNVATDILPVHSLTSRVMAGLGTPDLIVPPGASPHGHAMRPSEAHALEKAAVVFWIGEALTPWMAQPVKTLAGDATVVELLDDPHTHVLAFREGATFEHHDHDEDDHHADEHGDDHDDHAEDDHHDGDPHAWLDPENGKAWLGVIAETLSAQDPDNAETYRANAAEGMAEIDAVIAKLDDWLTPVRDRPFIVFHDAYHYFESRFGLAAAGSISLGDASDPSPARIVEIRDKVRQMQAGCVFSEPQFNAGLVATVFEGTEARTAVLDPLGTLIAPGPRHYPETLEALGQTFAACLN
ncbi:zinc ABC transporter substrate-binding protein [Actibacterium ureilyticum]|uniref:zinc ABC transporter substrate-binding protein n=1 Tax=Actibacterium ureilyticum TaxID=1590614 RepID=UPI000BAAB27E|nr:zinc ABC transporter substrate-binding protein [Actibacterium ureilyticum]